MTTLEKIFIFLLVTTGIIAFTYVIAETTYVEVTTEIKQMEEGYYNYIGKYYQIKPYYDKELNAIIKVHELKHPNNTHSYRIFIESQDKFINYYSDIDSFRIIDKINIWEPNTTSTK